VIVGVEPAGEGGDSFSLGAVGPCVGPFLQHGAVEPFDLAVGLGAVGAGALVLDVRAQGSGEGVGAVAVPVIGQHPAGWCCRGFGTRHGPAARRPTLFPWSHR
jgi:hypothetical protein